VKKAFSQIEVAGSGNPKIDNDGSIGGRLKTGNAGDQLPN
jgi:hypothetical protein